jgi:hypothetical protein
LDLQEFGAATFAVVPAAFADKARDAVGMVVLFEWARERWCTMREEFVSSSFLAVTVAGVVLLFSGLAAFVFI